MKTTAVLLFAFLIGNILSAQGIQFTEAVTDSDLMAINKRAMEEKKTIFIDCYTTWCGPCKYMEKQVFSNDTVARFYNTNFICVRMDMEKGVGISRTWKYDIYSYPTFIFLSPEGIVHRASGARDVKGFMELGETALNPDKRLSYWLDKYQSPNRETAFIREYLKQLRSAGMKTKEIADWYFATAKGDALLTKDHFEMIWLFLEDIDNPAFNHFFENRDKYGKICGNDTVDLKIRALFSVSFNKAYSYKEVEQDKYIQVVDEKVFAEIMEKVKNSGYEHTEEIMLSAYSSYYMTKDDWKSYALNAEKYVSKYVKDWARYNEFAWVYYENMEDKNDLNTALQWINRSMEIDRNLYNVDTYASLLYKLGRKNEALKAAEEAIALGKKAGIEDMPTLELLEKIRGMK